MKIGKLEKIMGTLGIALMVGAGLGAYLSINKPKSETPKRGVYPKKNTPKKPVEKEEYTSKYRFEVKDRSLKVYDKDGSNISDLTINLPQEYITTKSRIDAFEYLLGKSSNRPRDARAVYPNMILMQKNAKKITEDHKALQTLPEKERSYATEAINADIDSKIKKLLEEGKPEENIEKSEPREIF